MSPHTVEAHLTRIYQSLGVRGRTELAALRATGTSANEGRNRGFRDFAREPADRACGHGEKRDRRCTSKDAHMTAVSTPVSRATTGPRAPRPALLAIAMIVAVAAVTLFLIDALASLGVGERQLRRSVLLPVPLGDQRRLVAPAPRRPQTARPKRRAVSLRGAHIPADGLRPEPDAGPRSLLPARMEPWRGPSAVRHERQGLPRLRQRHRGHGAGPRASEGERRDPRPGRPDRRPINAVGFAEPVSRLAGELAAMFPEPPRLGLLPQLGRGGDRRCPEAVPARHRTTRDHRLPRRVPRSHLRCHQRHDVQPQLPGRLRPAPPGVHIAPFPAAYPDFGGDEEAASAAALADLRKLLEAVIPPTSVGSILIEPVLGEGGYNPAPASSFAGSAPCATSTASCSSPTRSRPGFGPHGEDVGVRARRDRARRRVRREGDRQRPAARRARRAAGSRSAGARAPTAPRSAATRSRAPPGSRYSR